MSVYLLHFERPIGDLNNPRGQAQHYVGFAPDGGVEERVAEHRAGTGARITAAAAAAGVAMQLVRVWDGGRDLERRIKRQKMGPRLCPVCRDQSKEQLVKKSFTASIPHTGSAIKIHGEAGMRITLDVDEQGLPDALALVTMRNVALRITVEPMDGAHGEPDNERAQAEDARARTDMVPARMGDEIPF